MNTNARTGIIVLVVIVVIAAFIWATKHDSSSTVVVTPTPVTNTTVYKGTGFSITLPNGTDASTSYKVDENYTYTAFGPGKDISGVKFIIPASRAAGTNLSTDSYISVEKIPNSTTCSASLFLDQGTSATVSDSGVTYSMGSTNGAAAGNRYEETVYALPGTNPCIAVRYFVHYGVFENYPAGSITEFNRSALLSSFDAIRRTLVVNQ